MNAFMQWIAFWNRQVKKFTIFDVKFAQAAAMALALIFAKLFPCILSVSIWWFVAACLICCVRPCYVMLFKRLETSRPDGTM